MHRRFVTRALCPILFVFVAGCGEGVDDSIGGDGDAGADSSGGGGQVVNEVEPNDERVGATQLPAGAGTFTIHGTCEDSTDNDYFDAHPSVTGSFTVKLTWQAGAYDMMWDPEDGFSGSQIQTATPPIMTMGQVMSPTAQFNIDCYNSPEPSGLVGLAYTVELTLP